MNIITSLLEAVASQDIDAMVDDICFNLYTKQGSVFFLCFYVSETESVFTFVNTSENGTEELKIIPKDNIEYIELVYQINLDVKKDNDEDKSYS